MTRSAPGATRAFSQAGGKGSPSTWVGPAGDISTRTSRPTSRAEWPDGDTPWVSATMSSSIPRTPPTIPPRGRTNTCRTPSRALIGRRGRSVPGIASPQFATSTTTDSSSVRSPSTTMAVGWAVSPGSSRPAARKYAAMPYRRFWSRSVAAINFASKPVPQATPKLIGDVGSPAARSSPAGDRNRTAAWSTGFATPDASASMAGPTARGTPAAAAYRFPVPQGRMPTSTPDDTSAVAPSRTVPSPPARTTSASPRSTAAAAAAPIVEGSPDSTTSVSAIPRRAIAARASTMSCARTRGSRIRDASGLTTSVARATRSGPAAAVRVQCPHGAAPVAHNGRWRSEPSVKLRPSEVPDVQRQPARLLLDHGRHLLLDHGHHDLVPVLHGPVPTRRRQRRHEGSLDHRPDPDPVPGSPHLHRQPAEGHRERRPGHRSHGGGRQGSGPGVHGRRAGEARRSEGQGRRDRRTVRDAQGEVARLTVRARRPGPAWGRAVSCPGTTPAGGLAGPRSPKSTSGTQQHDVQRRSIQQREHQEERSEGEGRGDRVERGRDVDPRLSQARLGLVEARRDSRQRLQ